MALLPSFSPQKTGFIPFTDTWVLGKTYVFPLRNGIYQDLNFLPFSNKKQNPTV
jgi:hypothetical protein